MARRRVDRARELGLDYASYASIRATSGRDVSGFLFSSTGLRITPNRPDPSDEIVEKLRALKGVARIAMLHAPLDRIAVDRLRPFFDAVHAAPSLLALKWGEVSLWAWGSVAVSGLLALSLAYVLWYTGVQRLGSSRTAIYSNLVPVVAMIVAALSLREPIGVIKLVGAALVLTALVLTRMERVVGMRPIHKGSGAG